MDVFGSQCAPIYGYDLVSLLSHTGRTANFEAFRNAAAGAFGPHALYRNCRSDYFSFHEVLASLASSGELEHRGVEVSLGTLLA